MQSVFRIHPIRCGTLTLPKDSTTYLLDRDVAYSFPVYAFLLTPTDEADDSIILVDTGVATSDSEFMTENDRTVGPPGGGLGPITDALSQRGLEPADVDTVVLTHLHHDHVANNGSFLESEFVVQAAEFEAARDPLPPLRAAYHDAYVRRLDELTTTVIDGDHQLGDGLELLKTPGHSAGMQSVIVDTTEGTYALIADLAYSAHNLDPETENIVDAFGNTLSTTPTTGAYIPPGIHVDVRACYESIDRVRTRVTGRGKLLSSHDPTIETELSPP